VKDPLSDGRTLLVVAATCIASAIVVALASGHGGAGVTVAPPPEVDASSEAPSYPDLRDQRRGPNANMYRGAVGGLSERAAPASDPAARAKRRAYDGAPPTVPHAVMQRGLDCVACHTEGAVIAGKAAPPMLHEARPSCTQCHVPSDDPRPIETPPPLVANDFVGLSPREIQP
jgi:cytochrome c-type protein NapB